jgi:hypothetical protein
MYKHIYIHIYIIQTYIYIYIPSIRMEGSNNDNAHTVTICFKSIFECNLNINPRNRIGSVGWNDNENTACVSALLLEFVPFMLLVLIGVKLIDTPICYITYFRLQNIYENRLKSVRNKDKNYNPKLKL